MTTPSSEKCPKRVAVGGRSAAFHTCGRPVKDEGLCGIHLAAQRKRAERDAAFAAKRTASASAGESAESLASEGLGLIGRPLGVPQYNSLTFSYTGDLVVPADVLRELIDLARKGQQS